MAQRWQESVLAPMEHVAARATQQLSEMRTLGLAFARRARGLLPEIGAASGELEPATPRPSFDSAHLAHLTGDMRGIDPAAMCDDRDDDAMAELFGDMLVERAADASALVPAATLDAQQVVEKLASVVQRQETINKVRMRCMTCGRVSAVAEPGALQQGQLLHQRGQLAGIEAGASRGGGEQAAAVEPAEHRAGPVAHHWCGTSD